MLGGGRLEELGGLDGLAVLPCPDAKPLQLFKARRQMTRLPPRNRGLRDASGDGKLDLTELEAGADATNAVHTSEHMRQRISKSSVPAYLFYTSGYTADMLSIDDIKSALRIYGGRQVALASAIGVTQPTVSRWLRGATPDPMQEARIREILSGEPPSQPLGAQQQNISFGDKDLPVYAAVEGGPGELVITFEPIDYVPRPWYLGQVRDGYGVVVVGESMCPAYEPGDMAIVHPKLPIILNKTYIFSNGSEGNSFLGTIKRLIGQNATEWKVQQHNPPRDFVLLKADWPKAVRVVGKYEG